MNSGIPEMIIIFLIVLLVFGAGKIPKIAKDIGSGIKEFKKAISGEDDGPGNSAVQPSKKTDTNA